MNHFLRVAIRFIRRESLRITRTEDYEFLSLAAQLFAIASNLSMRREDLREPPKAARSLRDLQSTLSQLSYDLDAPALYLEIINALVTVEGELCRHPTRDDAPLPRVTEIDLEDGEGGRLRGRVHHWLRPEIPALAQKREERYEKAEKRPPRPREHPMDHLDRLAMYLEFDDTMPRVAPPTLDFGRVIPLIDESKHDATVRRHFRIALCPLRGDFRPLFEVVRDGRFFRATGVENQDRLCGHLESLVEAAVRDEIHLLILPELTVPLEARNHLAGVLRRTRSNYPYGILAGSFHLWREDSTPPADPPVNEACLLDHTGSTLLTHWKKGEFRVSSSLVKPPFFHGEPPSGLAREVAEDIEEGTHLEILETSLGRLAVLICADAIAADPHHGYLPVIRRLRPDLLLIISMSPKTEPFERLIKDMSENWIGCLFVNASCICPLPERGAAEPSAPGDPFCAPLLAYCDLALHEPGGAPATRLLWRHPNRSAHAHDFHSPGSARGWRVLPDGRWPRSTDWLRHAGQVLGWVLDLGVHWE